MSNAADLAQIQKAEIELAQLEAEYGKIVAEASLAGASMLPPPAGTAADIASLTISLSKGNWGDALLDAVGFIPIVGDAAKAIIKGPKIVAQKNKIQTAIDAARVKLAQKKLALKTDPKELQKKTAEACKKGGIEPCPKGSGGNAKRKEVVVDYKRNPNHDPDEFKRQAEGQTKGLNDLTAGEIKENIENYQANGRPSEASSAIRKVRRKTENATSDQHVLHEPDLVIGGKAEGTNGLGDGRINSSIGSQNKNHQKKIYDAVKDLPSDQKIKFKLKIED